MILPIIIDIITCIHIHTIVNKLYVGTDFLRICFLIFTLYSHTSIHSPHSANTPSLLTSFHQQTKMVIFQISTYSPTFHLPFHIHIYILFRYNMCLYIKIRTSPHLKIEDFLPTKIIEWEFGVWNKNKSKKKKED